MIVDYRDRKTDKKDIVVPYDDIKPFVKIEDDEDDINIINGIFLFPKLEKRKKFQSLEELNIHICSQDYTFLWHMYLIENPKPTNIDIFDQKSIKHQKQIKNRLILESFLKQNTIHENFIQYQTSKIALLPSFSLTEVIIMCILNTYNDEIVNGFLKTNTFDLKRANVKKRSMLIYLKWIFEFKINVQIFDIMKDYVEGNSTALLDKIDVNENDDTFKNSQLFIKGKEISFNKRSLKTEEGVPIHILYQLLIQNTSIFSYEMIRGLIALSKKGIINFKYGVINFNHEFSNIFTQDLKQKIFSFISENNKTDAVYLLGKFLEKKSYKCSKCNNVLYFSKKLFCKGCGYEIRNSYFSANDFSYQQMLISTRTGYAMHYVKGKMRAMRLINFEKNKYKYTMKVLQN